MTSYDAATTLFVLFSIVCYPVYSDNNNNLAENINNNSPNERQKQVLHETVKNLLKIADDTGGPEFSAEAPPGGLSMRSKSSKSSKSGKAASKYMRRLFDKYNKHEIKLTTKLSRDENESDESAAPPPRAFVRAITPKIGRIQSRDALMFDLRSINPSELVITAEVHYYRGRNKHHQQQHNQAQQVKQQQQQVRCYYLPPTTHSPEGESIDIDLPLITTTDPITVDDPQQNRERWLVFDATRALVVNTSSNSTENDPPPLKYLAVIFAKSGIDNGRPRRRGRSSPMHKILRNHAPFLLISTRDTVGLEMATSSTRSRHDSGDQASSDEESMVDNGHEEDKKSINPDHHRRAKRNVMVENTKYYEYYHPYQTPFTTSPNDASSGIDYLKNRDSDGDFDQDQNLISTDRQLKPGSRAEGGDGDGDFLQRGPSILRRRSGIGGSGVFGGFGGFGDRGKSRRKKHHRSRWDGGGGGKKRYLHTDGGAYDDVFGGGAGPPMWDPPISEAEDTTGHPKPGKVLVKNKKPGPRFDDSDSETAVVLLDREEEERGKKNPATVSCRRHDLEIQFRDIGWADYVIAPKSFHAHYCAGSCQFPAPSNVNATNHAIVLDIIRKIGLVEPDVIPKSCCAPEKMDSLSLLYYDSDGNVVLTTYPKMSVVSCACL